MIYTDLWNVWAEKKIHCQTGFHVQRTPLLARQRTLSSDSLPLQLCRTTLENPTGGTSYMETEYLNAPGRSVR